MKKVGSIALVLILLGYLGCQSVSQSAESNDEHVIEKQFDILSDIDPPDGYRRDSVSKYGEWLRKLKLNKDNTVYYFNGKKKPNQSIHVAVLNFDVGNKDLQQCADACMRIRAEYLYQQKQFSKIKFLLANGTWKTYVDYTPKRDYKNFRKYLTYIFSYANTASLKKQLTSVKKIENIQPGDVFVQSGNPYGHAVTVMDVCVNESGNKQFMLSQSYMPAQSIEILVNPLSQKKTPWYPVSFEGDLRTPEWIFKKEDLRRFN